jgi:hypothetical protein
MKEAISIIVAILFIFVLKSSAIEVGDTDSLTTPNKESKPVDDKQKKKKKSSSQNIKQVAGEVKAIDMKAKTITVEGIAMATEDEKMLSSFKVGDKVTAKYVTRGRHIAISVVRE